MTSTTFYLTEALHIIAEGLRRCEGDETYPPRPSCDRPWTDCLSCPVTRRERQALAMITPGKVGL